MSKRKAKYFLTLPSGVKFEITPLQFKKMMAQSDEAKKVLMQVSKKLDRRNKELAN